MMRIVQNTYFITPRQGSQHLLLHQAQPPFELFDLGQCLPLLAKLEEPRPKLILRLLRFFIRDVRKASHISSLTLHLHHSIGCSSFNGTQFA